MSVDIQYHCGCSSTITSPTSTVLSAATDPQNPLGPGIPSGTPEIVEAELAVLRENRGSIERRMIVPSVRR
jgi:hypothetical protein